jgi:hypothetical protein
MRVRVAILTVFVMSLAVLLQPMQAFAASAWSITPTASALANQGNLNAVACTTVCFAVGSHPSTDPGSPQPLIEKWNGSAWSTLTVSLPAGAFSGELDGISCTSASACVAVGQFINSSGDEEALAVTYNGTKWSAQGIANPANMYAGQLLAVSCTNSTSCVAVGTLYGSDTYYGGGAFAESWNGSSWTNQPVAYNPGTLEATLSSVSCTAANACTAVGNYSNASRRTVPLVERWNGSSWAVQMTTNPTNASNMVLNGVVCTGSAACIAVGDYDTSNYAQVGMVERWNGTSWAFRSVPAPSGGTQVTLNSLSCTSGTACVAVGNFENSSGNQVGLSALWDGTNWTAKAAASLPGSDSQQNLVNVSCSGASACTAVGSYVNSSELQQTLAQGYNGSAWSLQTTKNISGLVGFTELKADSCYSSTACVAVGDYSGPGYYGGSYPYAEVWNGSAWKTSVAANPGGGKGGTLSGVSCYSSTGCMAVGTYQNSSAEGVGLAETLSGTTWTAKTVPTPSGGSTVTLTSVSCTSSTACTAVGYYYNSSFTLALVAESWNGTSWSAQTIPTPTGTDGYSARLTGVSCFSATSCEAVGNYQSNQGIPTTFAEAWNGSSWTIQTTPVPDSGSSDPVLNGVSCSAATTCVGVGSYYDNGYNQLPLVENLSGSTWTVSAAATPLVGYPSEFLGVSCAGATCTAVGDTTNANLEQVTLAEGSNGSSWSVQTTPNPSSGYNPVLDGVSCVSATCMAVGSSSNSYAKTVTLAEQYQ